MTAVIIDDELHCTDVMQILLTKHCPEVNITGIFNESIQVLDYLRHHQPDILFLDIEMPQMNGFDLLKNWERLLQELYSPQHMISMQLGLLNSML